MQYSQEAYGQMLLCPLSIIMLLDSCCLWSAIANMYVVIDAYSQMFLIVTGGLRSDVANDHIIAFGGMLLITT